MIYSSSRRIYFSVIEKARKDNSIVNKGESYIRVKKDKFSKYELFKNFDELDKKYPKHLCISYPELIDLLNTFNPSTIKAKEFLDIYFKIV